MTKKNIMTGIGIKISSISTDATIKLGDSYCTDIDKECVDVVISELPVYADGKGTKSYSGGTINKKVLLTPAFLEKNVPLESLYYSKFTTAYFPASSSQEERTGWDHFGKECTFKYVEAIQPPLEITTTQEDIISGYRDKPYNFLFESNQYAYMLEWSFETPVEGASITQEGYFFLASDGVRKESYTFKVKVFNPETNESDTKEFTLLTTHAAFVPDIDGLDLQIEGSSNVIIKPHYNFRKVWSVKGGIGPYKISIVAPTPLQWPYGYGSSYMEGPLWAEDSYNSARRFVFQDSTIELGGYSSAGVEDGFAVAFRKLFNSEDPSVLPGGLSENVIYYISSVEDVVPLKLQLSTTRALALSKTSDVTFSSPGEGYISIVYISLISGSSDTSSTGLKTVNEYVTDIALNIAIPPLPQHWGTGHYWDALPLQQNPMTWEETYLGTGASPPFPYDTDLSPFFYGGITYVYNGTKWVKSGNQVYRGSDIKVLGSELNSDSSPGTIVNQNAFFGQQAPALGLDVTIDPWGFKDFSNTATNYFDVIVRDFTGSFAIKRVTVQTPDFDFSETCNVPHWKGELNCYRTSGTPMKYIKRTTGTNISCSYVPGTNTYKYIKEAYDPDQDPETRPWNGLSDYVWALDELDYYTYPMTVYYPASRFHSYSDSQGFNSPTTYYPYEKFTLPLSSAPHTRMSIHPLNVDHGSAYRRY